MFLLIRKHHLLFQFKFRVHQAHSFELSDNSNRSRISNRRSSIIISFSRSHDGLEIEKKNFFNVFRDICVLLFFFKLTT